MREGADGEVWITHRFKGKVGNEQTVCTKSWSNSGSISGVKEPLMLRVKTLLEPKPNVSLPAMNGSAVAQLVEPLPLLCQSPRFHPDLRRSPFGVCTFNLVIGFPLGDLFSSLSPPPLTHTHTHIHPKDKRVCR